MMAFTFQEFEYVRMERFNQVAAGYYSRTSFTNVSIFTMTDSMNFGPEWLRNLSSDGTTAGTNTGGASVRYQLAEYRYGREEMLALYEKGLPAPGSLCTFAPLYSESPLPPLALQPHTDEDRQWQSRGTPMGPSLRGTRGGTISGERGGRVARGRGTYQPYGRSVGYETGGGSWGGVDNWRRGGGGGGARLEDDDGWRTNSHPARTSEKIGEKWSRSSSWREGDDERVGQPDKTGRMWHENNQRGPPQRRMWDNEDNLPEWATENLGEGGGTFDASGAFHGSDDEQDGKGGLKKDNILQKSASQQNITSKAQHAPLSTSKSAISLSKPPEPSINNKHEELKKIPNHIVVEEVEHSNQPPQIEEKEARWEQEEAQAPAPVAIKSPPGHRLDMGKPMKPVQNQNNSLEEPTSSRGDEEFDKLQEDLVLKLVVDEEPTNNPPLVPHSNGVQPPPNMMSPLQEKWHYQDPQGDLQGPFLSTEMAEWFKAGYFSANLFVRRQCDERFYTLGDLVTLCGGNPFQTSVPIAPLKQETKLPEDMMQYHHMVQAQMAAAALRSRPYSQGEPWNTMNNMQQQRDLLTQQFLGQQQVRVPIPPESYMQQPTSGNQLFQMLSQLKMNVPPPMIEKPPNAIPCQLDSLQALVQQMGGMQSMQRGMQPPTNLGQPMAAPPTLKHEPSIPTMHGLPVNGIPGPVPVLPTNNLISGIPKQPGMGKLDGDNNMNFLQFLQKPQMEQSIDLESLWRKNQYTPNQPTNNPSPPQPPQTQWQQQDKPISMWDLPAPTPPSNIPNHTPPDVQQMNKENANITKEAQAENEINNKDSAKEEKKRRELEEKRLKKEAEERRKQEQKKQELERKQQEDKRRKEEDRLKREMEKAKKESEEKRQKELAEKRRLKELRKAEEEARKKADDQKKLDDQERERMAMKEREEQQRRQVELARQTIINNQKLARAAPWSQSVNNQELSLAEIQKLERERKAEQVALMQQQRLQQEQISPEKPTSMQLNWANKPMKMSQVKSLAEIQAEEQERLLKLKQAAEKAQQKEKESLSPPAARIWQGQTLTWSNYENNSTVAGFWDEPPQQKPQQLHKPVSNKVNAEPKGMKQNVISTLKQPAANKTVKAKPKREEQSVNNNSSTTDDFSDWCSRTLANMNTPVDIPTFVTFLFDIESALDVREYCRDYLGDKPATQQFAAQFLEKRRLFKPKVTTHKDDMCSPAPAITPSTQHNSDFQEVKGKGKKCKKSKMLKVDARILGFNVTAAQDRINVGDRDYGDTT